MLHVLCVVFLVTTLDTVANSFTLVYGVANATHDGFPFFVVGTLACHVGWSCFGG
jgi:hypothetical protein